MAFVCLVGAASDLRPGIEFACVVGERLTFQLEFPRPGGDSASAFCGPSSNHRAMGPIN